MAQKDAEVLSQVRNAFITRYYSDQFHFGVGIAEVLDPLWPGIKFTNDVNRKKLPRLLNKAMKMGETSVVKNGTKRGRLKVSTKLPFTEVEDEVSILKQMK